MTFDVLGARGAGYSDDEIATYLAQENQFDIEGARGAGFSSAEIINHLVPPLAQPSSQPSEEGFFPQLKGSFFSTLTEGNPKLGARAIEGLGRVFGSDTMTQWGTETAEEYEQAPDKFIPREPDALESILSGDLGRISDAFGAGLGQGLASLAVPVAGAVAGAIPGSVFGPGGTVIGARAGAGLGSFALNYGDTYDYLVEQEKVEQDLAAKIAVGPGIIMAALDMVGLSALSAPFRDKTKQEISRSLTKRFLQLGKRGFTVEGATELAQQVVQELTGEGTELAGVAGADIELMQRLRNVVNAGIIGGLTGGTVGGFTSPLARPTDEAAPAVLPDVTEGLPETLEEDSADAAEQIVTTATLDPEADAAVVAEVATDEMEAVAAEGLDVETIPPTEEVVKAAQVEKVTDETAVPPITVDTTGLPVEETVPEEIQQVDIPPPPEGPAAPELGELDLEITEPTSPEFQPSSLETLPVVEDDTVIDVSTVTALNEAAENLAPKQEIPPHIIQRIRDNLVRRLRARGLSDDVPLAIIDTLSRQEMTGTLDAGPKEAKYIPRTKAAKGAIILALDAIPQSSLKKPKEMAEYLAGLTDHETVHSWVDLGVINNNDMNALAKAASQAPHWSDPNKTVMEVIQETYGDLNETEQIEEAAAEMFRGHAGGHVVLKGRPLSIWQRILNFFRNLKGGLAEADIYKAAQVFERIQTSPDFVAATAAAPAEDFGEELVTSLQTEKEDKAARTFHGGPNEWKSEPGKVFGVPRLEFMGTGEGAQAYGWGFYSAEAPGVGAQYRDDLTTSKRRMAMDGKPLPLSQNFNVDEVARVFNIPQSDASVLRKIVGDLNAQVQQGNIETYIDGIKDQIDLYTKALSGTIGDISQPFLDSALVQEMLSEYAEILSVANKYKDRLTPSEGVLYKLNIPDSDVAKYLDWDKSLSEQPIGILEKIEPMIRSAEGYNPSTARQSNLSKIISASGTLRPAITGEMFYRGLAQDLGSDQAASEALREVGIPGLKYFDADSRTRTARATIDGVSLNQYKPQNGYEEYIIDKFKSGVPFHEIQKIAAMRPEGDALLAKWKLEVPEGTRNYVTWDQDVLDRSEVVGVNEVPVNQIAVNLSAATGSIQGLQDLQDAANTGDIEAQQVLQDVASDSLAYLLSGVPGVRILSTPAQGLYFGDLEPSVGLDVGFAEEGRKDTLSALAKFADNFNQEQIHVRTTPDPDTDVSFVYPDGSFNTASVRFNLREPMSREEVEQIITSSGLAGMTVTDTYLDAYYVGDPSDAAAVQQFKQAADRAAQSLEGRTSGVDPAIQRLWAYGEGYGATNPYSDIRGPLRPPDAEEGNRTSWRIAQRLRGRPFIPVPPQQSLTPEQRDLQSDIADAFDEMPVNDLGNPQVRKAYNELARELNSQYRALPIKVEVWEGEGEPYANSDAMRKDVRENNHLYIYGTEEATFGPPGVVYDNHPMLRPSPFNDVNGNPLLVNDLLRAVHDYYAHTMEPNKFGPLGEEAAWQNHMRMTRSPWARWALTSETRGQNSWVNFHRLGIAPDKRADTLPITEREFSEQKTALLPIQYTMTGDPVLDQEMMELVEETAVPVETEMQDQLLAATSTDKEARRFTDLPPQAKKLIVAGYDTEGNATAKFGTIRHLGKDVPVVLPVGTPQDRGLLHVLSNEDHMHDFKYHTPYGWGPIRNERTTVKRALESLLKAYWNPELQAPRKGYAVADVTAETSRGRIRDDFVVLEWRDPASKYPIRAAFNLLDPAEVTGLQEPMFIMDTIFPVSGKENPAYQEARKELDNDGTVQLDNLSPAGRDAAIMAWKEKIKKDKLSRPISQDWSIKTKPTDMGVDIPSGMVMPPQHDTLGEKFLSNVGMLGGSPLDSYGDFFKWFRRSFVDMWDPVRRTEVGLSEQDAKYQNFLSASSSAWAAMRMARRGTAVTAYSLSKGVPTYRDGYTSVKAIPEDAQQTNIDGTTERSRIAGTDTGLIPIIEPLRNGNRFDSFHLYSIARRAARLMREGRERLLTQDQIAQYLAMGNTTAEIAQIMQVSEAEVSTLLGGRNIKYNDDFSNIFQDYQVWNGYFVDFLVDTGVLTREKADIWKETADYIPFYRQLDPTYKDTLGETDMFSGLTATSPPPELSGKGYVWSVVATDGNKVSTVLPTTFKAHEKKVAEGYAQKYKNETGMDVKVVRKGMPVGGFLDTLTENALSAVQTGMMNVGVQRTMRNLVLADPLRTVKTKPGTPGSVTFHVKGKRMTLFVADRALYASLNNYLENQRIPPWVNLLGMPARFLREMITRSPDFMAANMLRDSLSAWVTSGRNTRALAGTIGGFSQALRGSTSSEALAAAGLMTGFDFGGDPTKMTQFIEKELLKYKYPSAAGRFIRNPLKGIWDATGTASRASDAGTRIAVYERVLKETGDEAQAIFEAQEVINFSARGSSALIQQLAVMVPFLNARLQGLDVLYRSSMGRKGFAARPESDIVKQRFILRALLVGMSSAAYWALVHDDEEYINQNPEIKDNYWIIPASWIPGYDGSPLKFPIPFEVGFLFKTIPERVMALYFGKDVPRDLTRSLRQGLINTFEFNPIPQAALPAVESIANYSFWTGREIEGQYLKGLEPGYRANSRTSGLAIKLGKEFNYSPVKIDHMIRGYGGTLGTVLLDTVDGVMRETASDLGERPAKQLSEYPFVKRFIARPDARGLVTQFYDLRKAVNQAVKTAKMLEEGELTLPESEEFSEERMALLALEDEVKVISGVLSDLRNERKRVMQSDIGADAKRELIDEITAMELMAVESLPEMRQEAFQ